MKQNLRHLSKPILRFPIAAFVIAFVYLSFTQNIIACSCTSEAFAPACQKFPYTPVVFLGTPIEAIHESNVAGIYRFRVERIYKGLDTKTSEVIVDGYLACGARYAIGVKYLMFASISSGQSQTLLAGMCSGSRPVSNDDWDVKFLEDYLQGKTVTTVFGQVLQWVPRNRYPVEMESTPLKDATLTLENLNQKFTTVSDANGAFNFEGIPAGEYKLSAKLDPFMTDPPFYKVSVAKGCCGLVFVQLKAMSGIDGVLLKKDGTPMKKERVELLRKHRNGDWYSTYYMWTNTDNDGRFSFKEIESGEYLLGYEIWNDFPSNSSPFPNYYFSGTTNRDKAQTIAVMPGQKIQNLKLTLPDKHTERKITIKVMFPDGKPPGKNLLQISNQLGSLWDLKQTAEGVYLFTGYQEREYKFSARYWIDDLRGGGDSENKRITKSDIVKLLPGKEDAEIVLILNKTLLSKDDW